MPSAETNTALILDERIPYEPPLFLEPSMRTVTYAWPEPVVAERRDRSRDSGRRYGFSFWWNIQLLAAIIIGLVIYAALTADLLWPFWVCTGSTDCRVRAQQAQVSPMPTVADDQALAPSKRFPCRAFPIFLFQAPTGSMPSAMAS